MILSFSKFQIIKGCTLNNKQLIERVIEESEFHDFRKLAGDCVYNGIIAEINSDGGMSEELSAIMDKGVYECIAYFAYANYLMQGNVADTFSGPVRKDNPYSKEVSTGTLKNLYVYNRDIATEKYDLVRKIIESYFNVGCCNDGGTRKDGFSEIIPLRRGGNKNKINIVTLN